MKQLTPSRIALLLLLGLLLYQLYTTRPGADSHPSLPAVTDATFMATLNAADDWVLVEFYQDGCPPCKRLKPVLNVVAQEQTNQVSMFSAHVHQAPRLSDFFGIQGTPTMVLLYQGKELGKLTGYHDRDEITEWLDEYRARKRNPGT